MILLLIRKFVSFQPCRHLNNTKGANDDCLFYPQHKLDVCVLGKIMPMEALYITSFSNNTASFENWSVWNYINDTPSRVSVQSLDNFYTFDSIKINDEEFNNMQL